MKTTRAERRKAAKDQMDCIGRIQCEPVNDQAARVAQAAAKKGLAQWVKTGRMFTT